MLSIQQAGMEILGDNPKKFYVFGGTEYGIKCKYIEHLKEHYKAMVEVEAMGDVLTLFKKKQLIPLLPKLYVCRYDSDFISELSEKTTKQIDRLQIKGTVVCIYEDSKIIAKCNKHFPDNTVSFDPINPVFIKQYLLKDFPNLQEKAIDDAIRIHPDYMGAYNICLSLNTLSDTVISSLSSEVMDETFGYDISVTDLQIKQAFASRNYYECESLIENYKGDKNQIFYILLATMLEVEKLIVNPKQKSDIKDCLKLWDVESVYNTFMHIYHELDNSRNYLSYDIDSRLIYLVSLLNYRPIPMLEVMTCGIY
jgi:hypothetical protein